MISLRTIVKSNPGAYFRLLLIGTLTYITSGDVTAAESIVLRVGAGKFSRENVPVFLRLPRQIQGTGGLRLTRLDDNARIPVQQWMDVDGPQAVWLIRQPLEAGQHRDYRLDRSSANVSNDPRVTVRDDGSRLLLSVGDKPVLQYNYEVVLSPPGIDAIYRRSGHIHPIFNPAGQSVTDDFPPDHPHQHALFFPWVRTTFAGRELDFWNQAGQTARIEHVNFSGESTSGPVFGEFVANLRHLDITNRTKPVDVLHESWTVRVYDIAPYFLIDLKSRQRCATDTPLMINEYHYGGMAIRGSRQWFDEEKASVISKLMKSKADQTSLASVDPPRDYLTSEGKTWIDGNATRARWVEMHGTIDGRATGLTVMCHPGNFRAPQPVRLHPHKPYFCFAPMILGEFRIEPAKTFVSQYRFFVHNGGPDPAMSDRLWNDYAHPPSVEVVAVE